MKITFLGQGIEPTSKNAVGHLLVEYLKEKKFNSFIGFSAFASEAGIYGLSDYINSAKRNFKKLTIIVGVDQGGTSKEALEEILGLNIESYIFYQKENPIFHPKFYLFEGATDVKIILGSSNLTGTGLFTNIESSLLVEFNQTDKEGLALLSEIKTYYKSLLDFSDPNIFRITSKVINDFYLDGIVPDEVTRKRNYSKGTSSTVRNISKKSRVPKRIVPKIPTRIFPSKNRSKSEISTISTPISNISGNNLLWQKIMLSNSDAQIVPNGTAPTGNVKLTQAKFKINNSIIDQKTYFRNDVFRLSNWAKTKIGNNSYEETYENFDIYIKGIYIGKFNLKLSHDSHRISGQGNVPTWLHWGKNLTGILRNNNLAGSTFNLSKNGNNFIIEII